MRILAILLLVLGYCSLHGKEGEPPLVSVVGQVANPGQFTAEAGENVWTLMAKAGGTTVIWGKSVVITRKSHDRVGKQRFHYTKDTGLSPEEFWSHVPVKPGDIVHFEEIFC